MFPIDPQREFGASLLPNTSNSEPRPPSFERCSLWVQKLFTISISLGHVMCVSDSHIFRIIPDVKWPQKPMQVLARGAAAEPIQIR
jgi:hypothetical protein